jgi:hypothetical protein
LEQDGSCDLCDETTARFTPHIFTFGLATYAGDLCDACHRFVLGNPPPRGGAA